jgi:iron(III) transport system permease protein
MLITSLGLRNLDSVYIEASILSNKKRTIQKIILPLIKPHLIISCLFVFFLAISEYTTPAFLRVNTYTNEIFTQFAAFYNLYGAVIYSIPMVILALVFVSAIYIYLRNKSFVTISSFTKRWKNFIELSKNWKILSYLYILAILSFSLLIPFAVLLYTSKLQFLSAISLAKNSILDSILITTISSLLLTFLGFLTAYFIKNNKSLILLISFPLALSSSVIGISLINLYSNLPLPIYGTIVILIMGYLMKFIPFAVFIFSSFLSQISVSLEEAGRIFTSSQLKIIRKIFIPLSKNGFVSAFIILFIFIFSEIGITQLLSPPAFQTLTFRIDTLMHYGDYQNVASLSLILSTFVILFSLLYAVVFRNYDKS